MNRCLGKWSNITDTGLELVIVGVGSFSISLAHLWWSCIELELIAKLWRLFCSSILFPMALVPAELLDFAPLWDKVLK